MKKTLLFTCFLGFASTSFGQWSNDPNVNTPVMVKPGNQWGVTAVSDGLGSTIITWGDQAEPDYTQDPVVYKTALYAQKLSASGMKLWGSNGVKITDSERDSYISTLLPDGSGGVFVGWIEESNGDSDSEDIYVQKLDENGNRLWGNNGVLINSSLNDKWLTSILPDGSGNVIVSWEDERLGDDNWQIYVQKLNNNGVAQWAANGILVSDNLGENYGGLLYPDNGGGFVVLWEQEIENGGSDASKIYWQKMNWDGTRKSPSNTLLFDFPQSTAFTGIEAVTPDGFGGFYISFVIDDDVTAKLYLQHVLNDGTKAFGSSPVGIEVDASIGTLKISTNYSYVNYRVLMENDNAGGVVLSWTDTRSGLDGLYSQRFNSSGVKLWDTNDVRVVPAFVDNSGDLGMVRNQDGDFVYLISKTDATQNSFLYAQKVSLAGTVQYSSSGVAVATYASQKYGQLVASGDKVVVSWQDNRGNTETGFDIYAQSVFSSGVLPVNFLTFSAAYKNRKTELNWTTSSEKNNEYFVVERSADGVEFASVGVRKGAGTTSQITDYNFSDSNPISESGILYYRIKQVDANGDFDHSEIKAIKLPLLKPVASISYFPNPVKEKVTIDFKTRDNAPIAFSLIDLSGKIVLKSTGQTSFGQTEINLQSIPAGIYVLNIQSAGKSYQEKIVKN